MSCGFVQLLYVAQVFCSLCVRCLLFVRVEIACVANQVVLGLWYCLVIPRTAPVGSLIIRVGGLCCFWYCLSWWDLKWFVFLVELGSCGVKLMVCGVACGGNAVRVVGLCGLRASGACGGLVGGAFLCT